MKNQFKNRISKIVQKKDKAVSPIIATILLVAITVILASTLYLALGGFFSHSSTAAPTASVGVTNSTTSSGFEYVVSVGTPSSTVPLSSVILKITFSNGVVGSTGALTNGSQYVNFTKGTTITGTPSGNYVTVSVSPTTGNIGPGVTITITTSTTTFGVTSVSVVDTGSPGGTLGTASPS